MKKLLALAGSVVRPSAFHYVMFIACGFLFLSFGARYFFGGEKQLDVRFSDRRATDESLRTIRQADAKIYYGDDDRSARYADRLRDAAQIAISLGLYTVRERTASERREIPDIESVIRGLAASPLMPPGARVVSERGILLTQTGAYFVRYRPRPLAFEVLAGGARGLEDGAIFIVRFPEATGTFAREQNAQAQYGSFATVFVAPFQNAPVPLPFSPPDSFRAAGWTQEPLRSAPISASEAAEINRFIEIVSARK